MRIGLSAVVAAERGQFSRHFKRTRRDAGLPIGNQRFTQFRSTTQFLALHTKTYMADIGPNRMVFHVVSSGASASATGP